MPIHDLGYRAWNGRLAPAWLRWTVIAISGVRRAWQSTWLKRMMLFSWLPAIWFGMGFFFWEHSYSNQGLDGMAQILKVMPEVSALADLTDSLEIEDISLQRHAVWTWFMYVFFRYPQGVVMVLVVGIIAPPLISQDVRSRAFLLYFSRPIDRWHYALGKVSTVWCYLLAVTTIPALLLYVLGTLLSPNLYVVFDTWDLPFRILAASAVLLVPTASLALCLSSFTEESRYAGFAWFTVWILGWFTYMTMTVIELNGNRDVVPTEVMEKWAPVSLYHTLGQVQSWVFGYADFAQVQTAAAILVGLTVVSTILFFRQISAPLRA